MGAPSIPLKLPDEQVSAVRLGYTQEEEGVEGEAVLLLNETPLPEGDEVDAAVQP